MEAQSNLALLVTDGERTATVIFVPLVKEKANYPNP
jgi:hypothetical protein